MRILYIAPINAESAEAIAYLSSASGAMSRAGHDVYMLTWTLTGPTASRPLPFLDRERVRIVEIEPDTVRRRYCGGPWRTALSHALLPAIEKAVDDWAIEIVETSDQDFPAYAFFQRARTTARYRSIVLSTFAHGLNLYSYQRRSVFPTREDSDDLCSQRQMLRLSDIVLCPDPVSADIFDAFGWSLNVETVAMPFEFKKMLTSKQWSGRLVCRCDAGFAIASDRVAFFISQVADAIGLSELYLIGVDTATTFRAQSTFEFLVKRLKQPNTITVVQTGDLSQADATDLMDASDMILAFKGVEVGFYDLLTALDNGLCPLAIQKSGEASLFPADLQGHLLPADFSNQERLASISASIAKDKSEIVARLQQHNAERCSPTSFARQLETRYGRILKTKSEGVARTLKDGPRPNITVLIAAYNPDETLDKAIDCLASQSRRPDEIILCDDGSTHDLQSSIRRAKDRDLPIRLIRQRNKGLSGARNTLINAAGGELSLFLDCDDLLTDDALFRLYAAWVAADRPEAVIPTRHNFGESDEIVIRHMLNDHLHLMRNEYRMTALIKTSVLRAIQFDAMRRHGEADDWLFWLEFSARGYKAEFIPDPVFLYRFYTGSMSWPWTTGQAAGTADMIGELARRFGTLSCPGSFLEAALFEWHAAVHQAVG